MLLQRTYQAEAGSLSRAPRQTSAGGLVSCLLALGYYSAHGAETLVTFTETAYRLMSGGLSG